MDLSAIKAQLEAAANEDYQKTLASVEVERPSDQDLFKENQSTAAVVEEVIRYDAEAEKIRAAYASDSYHAASTSSAPKTKKSKVIEAEVVPPSSTIGGWGSYYGTSKSTTTTVVESQLEKERRRIDEEIDELFEDAVESVLKEEDNFDIFSMHEQAAKQQRIQSSFGGDRSAYQKYQRKAKRQAKLCGVVLKVCKSALKAARKSVLEREVMK